MAPLYKYVFFPNTAREKTKLHVKNIEKVSDFVVQMQNNILGKNNHLLIWRELSHRADKYIFF